MKRFLTPTGAIRAWWAIFMVVVFAVLVAGACIVYTNRTQHESDQRWCALLASLDQPEAPATTPRGQQIQQQVHELRHSLGCGGIR